MSDEFEYLDAAAVAERLGVKLKTIWQYRWRGQIPEPDVIFLGHCLWLAETIDEWRRQRGKRAKNRTPLARKEIAQPRRPVKVKRAGAAIPEQQKAMRKRSRAGAAARPTTSTIHESEARAIAAEFRASGTTCSTTDVLVLADHDGEGLDYERELLRQRIRQRLARR